MLKNLILDSYDDFHIIGRWIHIVFLDNRNMHKQRFDSGFTTKLLDVLRWGYGFSSIAGISHIRDTDCKASKIAWFILGSLGIVLTGCTVYQCFFSFSSYGTITTVSVHNIPKLKFPSVTICNHNRVHCRHLYNLIRNCTQVRK